MATQLSIEEYAYNRSRHITKRDKFLDRMDTIVPWEELTTVIAPYYHKNRKGRKPVELETILRMYLLREWYKLNDTGVEEAVYDSYAFRRFMKLDITREKVPDASTLAKFRKMLGRYKLTSQVNELVEASIKEKGYRLKKTKITEVSVNKVARKK